MWLLPRRDSFHHSYRASQMFGYGSGWIDEDFELARRDVTSSSGQQNCRHLLRARDLSEPEPNDSLTGHGVGKK